MKICRMLWEVKLRRGNRPEGWVVGIRWRKQTRERGKQELNAATTLTRLMPQSPKIPREMTMTGSWWPKHKSFSLSEGTNYGGYTWRSGRGVTWLCRHYGTVTLARHDFKRMKSYLHEFCLMNHPDPLLVLRCPMAMDCSHKEFGNSFDSFNLLSFAMDSKIKMLSWR